MRAVVLFTALVVFACAIVMPRGADAACGTCTELLAAVCPATHSAETHRLYNSVGIIPTRPIEPTLQGVLSNMRNEMQYRVPDPTSRTGTRNPTGSEWAVTVSARPELTERARGLLAPQVRDYRLALARHEQMTALHGAKYAETEAYFNAHIAGWRATIRGAFKGYLTRFMTAEEAEAVMVAVDDFRIILGDAFDANPGSRAVTVGRKELAIAIGGYPQHILLALAHEWAHCFDFRINFMFAPHPLPAKVGQVFGATRDAIRGAYPTLHDAEEAMAHADGYEVWADWFATQALGELRWSGDDYMRGMAPLCTAGNTRGYPNQDERMKLFGMHSRDGLKALCGGTEVAPACPTVQARVPVQAFAPPAFKSGYMPSLPVRPKPPQIKSIVKAVKAKKKQPQSTLTPAGPSGSVAPVPLTAPAVTITPQHH